MLAKGGADLSRVIMGHLDRTVFEFDALLSIAESGCYLEWDLFGNEGSYYPLAEIDMPSDGQRMGFIKRIADAGYSDKIVIGQDICTKHRLTKYGGHGLCCLCLVSLETIDNSEASPYPLWWTR